MNIVIYLLAVYGLTFLIRSADGPWGLMSKIRNKLIDNKYIGVFFYKMLDCVFCTAIHSSWIIFLMFMPFTLFELIVFAFAGASFSLIIEKILDR